jgi:hypothetical protein
MAIEGVMLGGLASQLLVTAVVRVPCLALVDSHWQTMAFILDTIAMHRTQEVDGAATASGTIMGLGCGHGSKGSVNNKCQTTTIGN